MKKSLTEQSDDLKLLDKLQQIYRQHAKEMPDKDLDKAIIAACYRELSEPKKIIYPSKPWWKRLSAPAIAFSTLVFTLWAANWYHQQPAIVPPGTAPSFNGKQHYVDIDFTSEPGDEYAANQSTAPASLESLQKPNSFIWSNDFLQQPKKPLQTSGVALSQTEVESLAESMDVKALLEQSLSSSLADDSLLNSNSLIQPPCVATINDVQVACEDYTKEKWLQGIKELLQQGKKHQATLELEKFHNTHPHYKLDDEFMKIIDLDS